MLPMVSEISAWVARNMVSNSQVKEITDDDVKTDDEQPRFSAREMRFGNNDVPMSMGSRAR